MPSISQFRTAAMIIGSVWLGLLLQTLLFDVVGELTFREWETHIISDMRYISFQVLSPWVFFSPFMINICHKFPITPENWVKDIVRHGGFLLLLTTIHVAALGFYYHYSSIKNEMMMGYAAWQHMGHYLVGDGILQLNLIIYAVFIASFNLNKFYKQVQSEEQKAAKLKTNLVESRLQTLKMQINPHFLFNALNSISVLVKLKNTETADEMIKRLSNFFRMTLEETNGLTVPLEKELQLIREYLAIEKIRFQDRLTITEDIEQRTLNTPIPCLLLQPIVENAIKHGTGQKEGKGNICIECKQLADRLLIRIKDDGAGCDIHQIDSSQTIGLNNVNERLSQVYNKDYIFDFQSQTDKGTLVVIEIPSSLPNHTHLNDDTRET